MRVLHPAQRNVWPLPTFAASASLGRTSSKPSLVIVTSTPVSAVNFAVLAFHWSSSPWMKRRQRMRRSFAPASGVYLSWAVCAIAGGTAAATAAAPSAFRTGAWLCPS